MSYFLKGFFQRPETAHCYAALEKGHTIWLFFGSDRGGRALAILASFSETCKKFGINPWQYLKDTLDRSPRGRTFTPCSRPVSQFLNRPDHES